MNIINNYKSNFQKWAVERLNLENVNEIINSDHSLVLDDRNYLINEYKKFLNQIKLRKGLKLTGLGSFLCFLSCVFTMLNILPQYRGFILVGLTAIGVALILYGFYLIFE